MKRSSGILMHISSLPSPYGIGTFGRQAYEFVDFLVAAGQMLWQVLPLGPTSYGDSPYQSFSSVAGNPYFIDPDLLIEAGLLLSDEPKGFEWGSDPQKVDYGAVYRNRFALLRKAYDRFVFSEENRQALDMFVRENASWLPDYALFMAIKNEQGGASWIQWPDDLRLRHEEALSEARTRLFDQIRFYEYQQFEFQRQWISLKRYANDSGISIIGDIPIYVPLDSVDVWASPHQFQLDEDRRPTGVAGVPPDYFTADGQLWGNPLYNWEIMKQDGYSWWMNRLYHASRLYDVIRIDHFRGISSYWCVPPHEATARNGRWVPGPGMDFIRAIQSTFPDLFIIAEDLGFLTEDVQNLVRQSGFPGMKILQFAFDTREPSNYLPHTYPNNCICYTGTHDNTTVAAWFEEADPSNVQMAVRYLGLNQEEGYCWGMIRGGMGSVADLFLCQMQDLLGLGAESRMNTPGLLGSGNWQWRMLPGCLTEDLAARLLEMTRIYGRL
jgi:4-alpha-glucanotransferase